MSLPIDVIAGVVATTVIVVTVVTLVTILVILIKRRNQKNARKSKQENRYSVHGAREESLYVSGSLDLPLQYCQCLTVQSLYM